MLCNVFNVSCVQVVHHSHASMTKDTSLWETATPWHSADVFTWYFWRQSDAHFRWRAINAIASHHTEKRDDDADQYRHVYWMLLSCHPIQLRYEIHTRWWTSRPFWRWTCLGIPFTEGMAWNQQSVSITFLNIIQVCLGQYPHHLNLISHIAPFTAIGKQNLRV